MTEGELREKADAIYNELMNTAPFTPEFSELLSELRIVRIKLHKLNEKISAKVLREAQDFNISIGTR